MVSYRTFYCVYDSDLDGSRSFQYERQAREYAHDMEKAVIVKRRQKMPEGENAWTDRSHEFVRKDFEHPFFDQILGGQRV